MKTEELRLIISKMNIEPELYSLEGDVSKVGSLVLYQKNNLWEIIGVDDKGNQSVLKTFNNEEEACEYLFNKLIEFKNIISGKYNLKNFKKKPLIDPPDIIEL